MRKRTKRGRRGLVLVIVLVVIMVLALVAYTFSDLMLVHSESAQYSARRTQTQSLVDSGADLVRWYLMQPQSMRDEMGGFYNNPQLFRGVPVALDEDPSMVGAFSIVAPEYMPGSVSGPFRFGLQDESERINLNFLLLADKLIPDSGRAILMTLPGMTEEIADSILDFIDPDSEPREFGFEDYSGMSPPYTAKNGPLDSVEELLLVRGVTPELLFGLDRNHNGIVDPNEGMGGVDSDDPAQIGLGWGAYFTLHSHEANRSREGFPRVFVNNEDMQQLHEQLSQFFPAEWVTFIVAYRQFGQFRGEVADADVVQGYSGGLDLMQAGRTPLTQVLDLIDKKVQVQPSNGDPVVIASPFTKDLANMVEYLPVLMNHATVNPSVTIPGRININRAPRSILLGIPGMDEALVDAIIDIRSQEDVQSDPNFQHETWLLTRGLLLTAAAGNALDGPSSGGADAGGSGGGGRAGQTGAGGAPTGNTNPAGNANQPINEAESVDPTLPNQNPTGNQGGGAGGGGSLSGGGTRSAGGGTGGAFGGPSEGIEPDLQRMRQLMPYVCAGGDVYRAQIVGYFQGGGGSARVEAVFDGANSKATVLFWRDISHLGRGFALDVLGINESAGTPLAY